MLQLITIYHNVLNMLHLNVVFDLCYDISHILTTHTLRLKHSSMNQTFVINQILKIHSNN